MEVSARTVRRDGEIAGVAIIRERPHKIEVVRKQRHVMARSRQRNARARARIKCDCPRLYGEILRHRDPRTDRGPSAKGDGRAEPIQKGEWRCKQAGPYARIGPEISALVAQRHVPRIRSTTNDDVAPGSSRRELIVDIIAGDTKVRIRTVRARIGRRDVFYQTGGIRLNGECTTAGGKQRVNAVAVGKVIGDEGQVITAGGNRRDRATRRTAHMRACVVVAACQKNPITRRVTKRIAPVATRDGGIVLPRIDD